MKKVNIFIALIAFLICVSCASSNNQRKRCKGVGSWDGKRNLSYNFDKKDTKGLILVQDKKNNITDM